SRTAPENRTPSQIGPASPPHVVPRATHLVPRATLGTFQSPRPVPSVALGTGRAGCAQGCARHRLGGVRNVALGTGGGGGHHEVGEKSAPPMSMCVPTGRRHDERAYSAP